MEKVFEVFSDGGIYIVNPAVTFSQNVKDGRYDSFTDEEYLAAKSDVERLSVWFLHQREMPFYEWFCKRAFALLATEGEALSVEDRKKKVRAEWDQCCDIMFSELIEQVFFVSEATSASEGEKESSVDTEDLKAQWLASMCATVSGSDDENEDGNADADNLELFEDMDVDDEEIDMEWESIESIGDADDIPSEQAPMPRTTDDDDFPDIVFEQLSFTI